MISLDHYRKLEADSRRASAWSTSSKLPHPDECPKLKIRGVEWSIRPRGIGWRPTAGPNGKPTLKVEGEDNWAGTEDIIAAVPVHDLKLCEACGSPLESEIEVDADKPDTVKWLEVVVGFVWQRLDDYYEMTPEQKSDLLSFDVGRLPEWVEDVLTLCRMGQLEREVTDG